MSESTLRCLRCGAPNPPGARYCWHCGTPAGRTSGGPSVVNILCAVLLGLVALPIGAMGACFGLIGMVSLSDPHGLSGALGVLGVAAVLIGLAVLGIFGMVKLLR